MAQLPTGFPNAPLVDPATGEIADVWRRFFLTLTQRTGGTVGTDAAAAIAAEVAARESGDTSLSNAMAHETAARIAADSAETAARRAADLALSTALSRPPVGLGAEAATRAAADLALRSRIWFGR
jgi:hypothetical protein